jgi:hypothetical protein
MSHTGVYLMGGLGNQLFQYLFALQRQEQTGQPVVLLLDWFQGNQLLGRAADRPLQLPRLLQPALPMTTLGLAAESGVLFSRLFRFEQEGGVAALPAAEAGNLLCMGYYQMAEAMPSAAVLASCLGAIGAPAPDALVDGHAAAGGVALHVRLGDYRQLQHVLPILPLDYYAQALARLPQAARYLVFAEDAQEARAFLEPLAKQYAFEFVPAAEPVQDFRQLASMPVVIGANSTFSLLAGWAARLRGARVLMPAAPLWHGPGFEADVTGKHSLLQRADMEVLA